MVLHVPSLNFYFAFAWGCDCDWPSSAFDLQGITSIDGAGILSRAADRGICNHNAYRSRWLGSARWSGVSV